jgi:hypothetical protein
MDPRSAFDKTSVGKALKVAFLVLDSIACAKDASVAANLELLGGSI